MRRTDIIEQAEAIRKATQEMSRTAPDEVALSCPALFDQWAAGVELYRCLTAHTSQESWTPDVSPSLWVRIADPAEEWPEWVQPQGSTDAYSKGDKVTHKDKHWTSTVDNNVWEPGVYGWEEN